MIQCAELRGTANITSTIQEVSVLIQDEHCPIMFRYDGETKQCECLSSLFNTFETVITCVNDRGLLRYSFCLTHKEETSTVSLTFCSYFEPAGHNISEPGFISLPDSISELNDYMCGPLNRKGIVCNECIDGYGPSVNSPKFVCSDYTDAWYGVPLYLLLELVPVTVFYLIVIIFQVNVTSAPMTSFIFTAILFLLVFTIMLSIKTNHKLMEPFLHCFTAFGSSLHFFHCAIPPFCVSPHLKIIHALYLHSVSTIFPFVLIGITWICIKLHSRDYKIVTVPWQLLKRLIFKHIKLNVKWNSGRTVVDSFATFFLLSFSKMTFMLLLLLSPQAIHNLNFTDLSPTVSIHSYTDLSINFVSKEHLPFAAVSIALFLFDVFLPVVLTALYPIQAFRSLLFKCLPKWSIAPLSTFCREILQLLLRRSWWWKGHEELGITLLHYCSSWLHFEISWINSFSRYCTIWWV